MIRKDEKLETRFSFSLRKFKYQFLPSKTNLFVLIHVLWTYGGVITFFGSVIEFLLIGALCVREAKSPVKFRCHLIFTNGQGKKKFKPLSLTQKSFHHLAQ